MTNIRKRRNLVRLTGAIISIVDKERCRWFVVACCEDDGERRSRRSPLPLTWLTFWEHTSHYERTLCRVETSVLQWNAGLNPFSDAQTRHLCYNLFASLDLKNWFFHGVVCNARFLTAFHRDGWWTRLIPRIACSHRFRSQQRDDVIDVPDLDHNLRRESST